MNQPLNLFDTHCHIQSIGVGDGDFTAKKWREAGIEKPGEVIKSANVVGVKRLMLVGTDLSDSKLAIDMAAKHDNCWASVGIHPHEAGRYQDRESLQEVDDLLAQREAVAIGECGLDYYYEHSSKKEQIKLLEFFLDKAQSRKLPVIFHVREAYSDFWSVLDNFKNINGVVHSFSATTKELHQTLSRDLYIGLNGIMTFTKDEQQLEAAKRVPLEKLLLETDAPYLTPKPFRGKICTPEHVAVTAHFLAELRQEAVEQIASVTTANASELFNIARAKNTQ